MFCVIILFNLYEVKKPDGNRMLQYLKPYGLKIIRMSQNYDPA